MSMEMEWRASRRWSISQRYQIDFEMLIFVKKSDESVGLIWTALNQVLTEPIVAGRLYGGMMERVADEVTWCQQIGFFGGKLLYVM